MWSFASLFPIRLTCSPMVLLLLNRSTSCDDKSLHRLQKHPGTRQKQMSLWKEDVKLYCADNKLTEITIGTSAVKTLPIFVNNAINRWLSENAIRAILQSLADDGDGEWFPGRDDKFIVWWKPPSAWADELMHWVRERGMDNEVVTVHEVLNDPGDGAMSAASEAVVLRAAKILERVGKGRFLPGDEDTDPSFKLTV